MYDNEGHNEEESINKHEMIKETAVRLECRGGGGGGGRRSFSFNFY